MEPSYDACLALLRELRACTQLQHAWTAQLWQHERDLHPAAAGLLAELARHGESRPSELAKRRMVDLSVISRQLTQLLDAGLVERRPAPEDGRAALFRVSELGEREITHWQQRYVELLTGALHDWDEQAVTALATQLGKVNDELRATVCPGDAAKGGT